MPHHFLIDATYRLCKIPIRPKNYPPQKLLQLWILLHDHSARALFNLLTIPDILSSRMIWMKKCTWSSWILNSLIHYMLSQNTSYNNFLKRMTNFASQQNPPMIFQYLHQMTTQPFFWMDFSIVSAHSQVMSEFVPLRQV